MNKLRVHYPIKAGPITLVVLGEETAQFLKGDEEFEFVDPAGKTLGSGLIQSCWAGPLNIVPASLLEAHHDPACRTYSGLVLTLRLLNSAPGLPSITPSTVVSVLSFQVTGGEIIVPRKPRIVPS